jgi:hypothetical protein
MVQVDVMKLVIQVVIVQVIFGYDSNNFSKPRWKNF